MSKLGVAFLALVLSTGFAPQTPAPAAVNTTYGIGALTCGKWVVQSTDSHIRPLQIQWTQGFVSGWGASMDVLSETDGSKHRVLRDSDGESMMLFMDNYCKTNPLERVRSGALALVVALIP